MLSEKEVTDSVSVTAKLDSSSSLSTATGSSLRRGRFEISEVDSPSSSSVQGQGILSSSAVFVMTRRSSVPSVIEESAAMIKDQEHGDDEAKVSVSVPSSLATMSIPSLKPPVGPGPSPMSSSMAVGEGSPTFSSSSMLESTSSTLQLVPTPAGTAVSATSSPLSTKATTASFSKTEPLSLKRGAKLGELILSAVPRKSGMPRASSEVPLARRRSGGKKTFAKGRFVVRDISSPILAIDPKKVEFLDRSFEEEDINSYEEDDDVEDEEELELKDDLVQRRIMSPRKMTSPMLMQADPTALNSARTIKPTSSTTEDAKALKSSLQVFASIPRSESLASLKTKLAEVISKERKASSSSDSMIDDDSELNKMDLILHIVSQHFESCHTEIEELRKQNETLRAVNRRLKISAACRSPSV